MRLLSIGPLIANVTGEGAAFGHRFVAAPAMQEDWR